MYKCVRTISVISVEITREGEGAEYYMLITPIAYTVQEPLEIINILDIIIKRVLLDLKHKKQKYLFSAGILRGGDCGLSGLTSLSLSDTAKSYDLIFFGRTI